LRIRSEADFATYWAQEERRRNGRGSARRARNVRLRTTGAEEHVEKRRALDRRRRGRERNREREREREKEREIETGGEDRRGTADGKTTKGRSGG